MLPEFPEVEMPELNTKAPLTPFEPEETVLIVTEPLVDVVPEPPINEMAPPVAPLPAPPAISMAPPCPVSPD